MRMVSAVAMMRCRDRRAGGVMRCVVGRRSVRDTGRRRPGYVAHAIVHGARVQCRRLLLNHEGPGREDRGNRATTRGPQHYKNYDYLVAPATPARCAGRPGEIIESGKSA